MIKAQALTHFVTECSFSNETSPNETELAKGNTTSQATSTAKWKLHVDGSSTSNRSGAGLILISPKNFQVKQAVRLDFKATNNQAEYEALIAGLNLVKSLEVNHISIFSDSQLVIQQTTGDYATKYVVLSKY